MHDLWAYCGARRLTWLVLLIGIIINAGIIWLENLPVVALLDQLVIGAAFLIPLIGYDAWRWQQHYHQLKQTPQADPLPYLPTPQTATDQRYQAIITTQNQARVTAQVAAQKQAQTLNDNFALWSHQMKTPLAALDLLLQVTPINATQARTEVKRVDRYVQMMLTYIKFNDVNRDLVLVATPLTPLVKQVVRELADLFIGKNLAVQVDPLPTVVTDAQWLRFIFEQLLTNAAKYTETGSVHVYAQGAAIVVADTGIGIAASDLPRLFEPGFSGYNGRMNQKASGLGLAMSQTIAEKLGLKLSVQSQVGRGTQVYLHLAQQAWPAE